MKTLFTALLLVLATNLTAQWKRTIDRPSQVSKGTTAGYTFRRHAAPLTFAFVSGLAAGLKNNIASKDEGTYKIERTGKVYTGVGKYYYKYEAVKHNTYKTRTDYKACNVVQVAGIAGVFVWDFKTKKTFKQHITHILMYTASYTAGYYIAK